MRENPLIRLWSFGQSVWLDFISRGLFETGELRRLIEQDGLRGMTSNPSIFDSAISNTTFYDETIRESARQGKSAEQIVEAIMIEDVGRAADLFRPVYDGSGGLDGFVSLEVSPHLAYDTHGTIDEAQRLWAALDRPNVMIKVPGTSAGLPAIERLIAAGVNVNVTLLFGLPRYRRVAQAYLAGLLERANARKPIEHVASVASFFLSRFDVLLDPMLESMANEGGEKAVPARECIGEVAIAQAKSAYQIYKEVFAAERFRKLADDGARVQRLLWASTSTKNPKYPDTKYVEPLIGPDTINTMPMETLEAYRDHGNPDLRIEDDLEKYRRVLERLAQLGISIGSVTDQLEKEGVQKFVTPYDRLVKTTDEKRARALEQLHV
jgi:transaldolase